MSQEKNATPKLSKFIANVLENYKNDKADLEESVDAMVDLINLLKPSQPEKEEA